MYPASGNGQPVPVPPVGPVQPVPPGPVFRVTVTKHTGALFLWFNQRQTITGSYAQCDAAITRAQQHNLIFGWWSFLSVLLNPIALLSNSSARKSLQQQTYQAHQYAQWWASTYGARQQPSWTPPPGSAGPGW